VGVIVADARLVVVPGGLGAATVITFSGSLAPQLNLTGGNGEALTAVYLSGALSPFPVLTTLQPAVSFSVAGVTHTVTLPARPGSSTEAAALLEAAIRGFPEAGFANARVIDLGAQLLVLPGAAGAVVFAAVAGGDAATVVELQLAASYRVRVRVNGAESVDDVNLDLPS
jgi:multisubunit Na+/H+ antiporter MnhB subunit